jgi:hypothetical protein
MTFRRSAPAAIIAAVVVVVAAVTFASSGTQSVASCACASAPRYRRGGSVASGISFLINLLLVRFRVVERTLGRYTQEQCYLVLRWAFPALVLTMAVAMALSAIA